MPGIKIADISIGTGCPPFIIAEAGINHNGDLERALEMIRAAKKSGVDAVKFQTFKAEEFCGDPDQMFTYRSQCKEVTESMLEMFKRYEFSEDEWRAIKQECDKEEILFMSTPQNRSDLDLLLELGIPAIKVGSDDFTNLPLLEDYASTGLPMIVSCGMADQAEIHDSLEAIGALDGYPTVLMLCTSQYPTPAEDVNLLKLRTLADTFPMIALGFSDHTQGPLASSLAVAFHASVFEKHFTLDHDLPGPDHWFSENIQGLGQWVDMIRKAHVMLGDGALTPTKAEEEMKILARRSIVAINDIPEGEELTTGNIGLRRPGNGLPPAKLKQVLGLKANHFINKGSLIKSGDFK